LKSEHRISVPGLETAPKGILLPRCHICSQVPAEGFRSGIRIKKAFICKQCETDIINMDMASARYELIMNKIKSIFKTR
jgi:hypothetical protein